MQLPFVLQSAETMKTAVAYLEPHMEKADAGGKGRVVLATVKGDVHDIGKNLVDIILTNNGYEVHNLGIKVADRRDDRQGASRSKADAIGMSGLLVKSTLIMRENLEELNDRGLADIPVLLGGAALTRTYVERDLREVYEGRALLRQGRVRGPAHDGHAHGGQEVGRRSTPTSGATLGGRKLPPRKSRAARPSAPVDAAARRSDVATDIADLHAAVPRLPRRQGHLARRHRRLHQRDRAVPQPVAVPAREARRERRRVQGRASGPTLRAQLDERQGRRAGSCPRSPGATSRSTRDGNDLVVWTDDDRTHGAAALLRSRASSKAPFLCIADFFRPVDSGEADYAAFHVVTMGAAVVASATAELFAADQYQDYLLLHGLASR